MYQEKPEQAVESVADAENVGFVVKPCDIADFDCVKSPSDGRVAALRKKLFFKGMPGCQFTSKYGRKSQETLVGIIV